MGILQSAYRTFETYAHKAGIMEQGKAPLTPISHMIQNAQIEITLKSDGKFDGACKVDKKDSKTIIPASLKSASRTSDPIAHPLSDNLQYIAKFGGDKFANYVEQLESWANSEHTHPKVRAILAYIKSNSIIPDLARTDIINIDENGKLLKGNVEATEYAKCLVRWRVLGAPEGSNTACFEDITLFNSYINYFASQRSDAEQDFCYISGDYDIKCKTHAKGIVVAYNGAKLASSNDKFGLTFRGRFEEADQAVSIGYTASQKAHNALRWVVSNNGVIMGGRTFICWNPVGEAIPISSIMGYGKSSEVEFIDYKQYLQQAISGYKNCLQNANDNVVITVLDAATTGRLSVTYYNELKASDFLDRLEYWFDSCCLKRSDGVYSPTLKQIINCAFGTERNAFIETDDKLFREGIQRIWKCIVDKQSMPLDVVKSLVNKASTPLAYKDANREHVIKTACAVLRKYYIDKNKIGKEEREGYYMTLDKENTDINYLLGRLLAVYEKVEKDTYDSDSVRDTNAIRMQAIFVQRPSYAWGILENKLNPYFAKHKPGMQRYFKDIIGEITEKIGLDDLKKLDKLDSLYLLGYYHQRTALYTKKESNNTNNEEE